MLCKWKWTLYEAIFDQNSQVLSFVEMTIVFKHGPVAVQQLEKLVIVMFVPEFINVGIENASQPGLLIENRKRDENVEAHQSHD